MLFLPNNTTSTYGYGGYGFTSYGTTGIGATFAVSGGYGGSPTTYGYGGWTIMPRPPINVDGGFGGGLYGLGAFGSKETFPPQVSSATSLDGNIIKVFFNEPLLINERLSDPSNYTITPTLGANVEILSVQVIEDDHTTYENDITHTGASSVLLIHSGTTLGGTYELQVENVQDLSYNEIDAQSPTSRTQFYALGTETIIEGVSNDGDFVLTFSEPMGVGSDDFANYQVESSYPVVPIENSITKTSPENVRLAYTGITTTDYDLQIGELSAITLESDFVVNGVAERIQDKIWISKEQGNTFDIYWADTSSPLKILPNSSYTASISFDFSQAHIRPYYLTQPIGELFISDGAIEIALIFKQVGGQDVVEFSSGATVVIIPTTWSQKRSDILLVRNDLHGLYALLINGVCVLSVPVGSVTGANVHGAGITLALNSYYRILQFPLLALDFTASQTVYTVSGNFINNSVLTIRGASSNLQEILLTENGPLTKDWGDSTPATKQDVAVRVNGVSVEIDSVNPYQGAIQPLIPIPLMPVGLIDVEIDYQWHKNPMMGFAALNTEGLTLNKWDRANHLHNTLVNHENIGVPHLGRFPFGAVLPLLDARPSPKQISHRYIGYERDYSSVLNSPTTMRLNQDPHKVAIPELLERTQGDQGTFDGNSLASDSWEVFGTIGESLIGDGTTRAVMGGIFYQEVEYVFPKSTFLATRFKVEEYETFGVFTGISFGVKTLNDLYLVGLLEINGVKHLGVSQNIGEPNELSSWELALEYDIELLAQDKFSIATEDYPVVSSSSSVRFQVLEGTQAGIYTVVEAINQTDGTTTVTVSPSFPADRTLWGNNPVKIHFEFLFDQTQTYQLVSNTDTKEMQLYLGGAISGLALSTTSIARPIRSEEYFGFDEGIFWGTLDMLSATIQWSLVQYGTTPKYALQHSRGVIVAEHFAEIPSEWFVLGGYGQPTIDIDEMELVSWDSYTFNRVEPFFKTELLSDTDFFFSVEKGIAQVIVDDAEREIIFQNILYRLLGTGEKELVTLHEESLSGKYLPQGLDWVGESSEIRKFNDKYEILESVASEISSFPPPSCNYTPSRFEITKEIPNNNRGWDIELVIKSETDITQREHPTLLISSGTYEILFEITPTGYTIGTSTSVLFTGVLGHLGIYHKYTLRANTESDTLSFLLDNVVVQVMSLSDFAGVGDAYVRFATEQHTFLDYLTLTERALSTDKRTLGILREGDSLSLDSWEIPRTDNYYAPNSSVYSVIEEMDWRNELWVRLHRDPTWGVTLYRPDLVPPPYFTGEFATETTDPSAGWINIEYADLPKSSRDMGFVSFGVLGVASSRWDLVRNRLFQTALEDFRSPHHMVLNQYNVITSDERYKDISIESVEVESLSNQVVSLIPTNIFANQMFSVVVNDHVAPLSAWYFDEESQTIFFHNPVRFSSEGTPLFDSEIGAIQEHFFAQVSFSPSKTRTKTYLENQELSTSVTLLNEGTPPVPKSQIRDAIRELVFGSGINVPQDYLNLDPDFYLNDPSKSIQFRDSEAHYENLEFITKETSDEEPIEIACDDFNAIELYGTKFSETLVPIKQGVQQVGSVLHLSGGTYRGRTLGGVNATLLPNMASHSGVGANNQQVGIHLKDQHEDSFGTISDNDSCEGVLTDYANLYSRIARWGNIEALAQNSFLYGASSVQPSGIPNSGQGLIAQGGNPLPQPTITSITFP